MSELNVIDLVDGNAYEPGADGYIIKAGQGTLEYNWQDLAARALADGKPLGLYWLIDARYSPEGHKAAIKTAFPEGKFGDLGLWLDIEKPLLNMTDAQYRALPYAYYKPVESVWRGVQAYTGKYPGQYFGPGSWDLIMSGTPEALQQEFAEECECWIAHYGAAMPSMRGLWGRWAMWQWREGPDYNRVNAEWWQEVSRETGGTVATYQYSITPATADGSKIRTGPGTQYGQANPGVLRYGDTAYGNELYAPSSAEIWLHILAPVDGWVSAMHNGQLISVLVNLNPAPPPEPPPPAEVPHMRQVMTDDDGTQWLFECDGVKL